jgi:colicin import membrane protein
MVNPIRNQPSAFPRPASKKKAPKESDVRVKKAAKKTKPGAPTQSRASVKASPKVGGIGAFLAAEKASQVARQRAIESQKAAQKAQKAALLARQMLIAQQAAAARRARAAEKAKREALKAAKRAKELRRVHTIRAILEKPEEKKRRGMLKKYLPSSGKKSPLRKKRVLKPL